MAQLLEGVGVSPVPGLGAGDRVKPDPSAPAPSPVPVTIAPHLVVIVRCPPGARDTAALEVVYRRGEEQVARNVQPLSIEPGKFNYRLVRAELTFEEYGTIEAHCRIDLGTPVVVPYTLLPPV